MHLDAKRSVKVNSAIYVCLRISYHLVLIIRHWSYFKYNDFLHTENVYKMIANELHVVNSWSADEASVLAILSWKNLEYDSLILGNCKKTKTDKTCKS